MFVYEYFKTFLARLARQSFIYLLNIPFQQKTISALPKHKMYVRHTISESIILKYLFYETFSYIKYNCIIPN